MSAPTGDEQLNLLRVWVQQGMGLLQSTLGAWMEAESSRAAMRNALQLRGNALSCAIEVIAKLRAGQPCEEEYRRYQDALLALQHESLRTPQAPGPSSNPAPGPGTPEGTGSPPP